jgi:hypothetical protein
MLTAFWSEHLRIIHHFGGRIILNGINVREYVYDIRERIYEKMTWM